MSETVTNLIISNTECILKTTDSPKVCIIILNWNGLRDTVECLESIRNIVYSNYEVVVVDNASSGNDTEVLKDKFGNSIQLIENPINSGFAEGCNIGMRYALGDNYPPDYFLLLNNDTIVAPDFLTKLVEVAESDAEIGIVGPMIYFYDTKGSNNVIWSASGNVCWWMVPFYWHLGYNQTDSPEYQVVREAGFVSGAAMMLKRHVVEEISFLNSHYFFGYEEIECCLKARKMGYKIIYVPDAKIWHKERRRYEVGYNPSLTNPALYYYLVRNNFSKLVYYYQLVLFPRLLLRWGHTYLTRYRDTDTLLRFLSDISRAITKKRS